MMIDAGRLVVSGPTDSLLERTGVVTVDVGREGDRLVAALTAVALPAVADDGVAIVIRPIRPEDEPAVATDRRLDPPFVVAAMVNDEALVGVDDQVVPHARKREIARELRATIHPPARRRDDLDHDRHEAVLLAAELHALAAEGAGRLRAEPEVADEAVHVVRRGQVLVVAP